MVVVMTVQKEYTEIVLTVRKGLLFSNYLEIIVDLFALFRNNMEGSCDA